MLILIRQITESVVIGQDIKVTVLGVRGKQVRWAFPRHDICRSIEKRLRIELPTMPKKLTAAERLVDEQMLAIPECVSNREQS